MYSEKFIKQLVSEIPGDNRPLDYMNIYYAISKNYYSEDFINILVDKVKKEDVCDTIGVLIERNGFHQESVERLMSLESEGTFDAHIPWIAIQKGYSEDVFLYVFNNVKDKATCIVQSFTYVINQVAKYYSEKTVETLVDSIIVDSTEKLEVTVLDTSIKRKLSEKIVLKILDRVDSVNRDMIVTAKQMHYSNVLLEKMEKKSESKNCIVQ